jgi:hypothetical protein
MSEPCRLSADPEATPFERELLGSWSTEQPSEGARARVLTIAGLAAAGVATTAAGTSTIATAGSAAPQAAIAGVGVWKLTVVALVAIAVTAIAVAVATREEHGKVGDARPASVEASPAATSVQTSPPSVSASDLPSTIPSPATLATVSSARPAAVPPPAHDTSLAEEISRVDRAKRALDSGDADAALAVLDEYARHPGSGSLLQEAEVLRVRALLHKGDRIAAGRVGERFLEAHPTSPHAARVRAMLESSSR